MNSNLQTVDFEPSSFEPFLPTAVSELINLMGEADSFESKRRIDNTLNVVIEQVKEMVIVRPPLHLPWLLIAA